jgi:hypothetical protein
MMNGSLNSRSSAVIELRLLSRGLSFLALLTAVLYLRVLITGGLFINQPSWLVVGTSILMVGGLLALVALFRWERIGSMLAIAAGVGLFLLFWVGRQPLQTNIFYSSPFIVTGLLVFFCQRREKCYR